MPCDTLLRFIADAVGGNRGKLVDWGGGVDDVAYVLTTLSTDPPHWVWSVAFRMAAVYVDLSLSIVTQPAEVCPRALLVYPWT